MKVICEISARHVHLSKQDLKTLFNINELTPLKPLSQTGQFLSHERVNIKTEKGEFKNVAIIGPTRESTQVELSRTDFFNLGIKPENNKILVNNKILATPIIAQRHLHIDPTTAKQNNLQDGDIIKAKFDGERGGILHNVVVRVDKNFTTRLHIDTDEANALDFAGGMVTIII